MVFVFQSYATIYILILNKDNMINVLYFTMAVTFMSVYFNAGNTSGLVRGFLVYRKIEKGEMEILA